MPSSSKPTTPQDIFNKLGSYVKPNDRASFIAFLKTYGEETLGRLYTNKSDYVDDLFAHANPFKGYNCSIEDYKYLFALCKQKADFVKMTTEIYLTSDGSKRNNGYQNVHYNHACCELVFYPDILSVIDSGLYHAKPVKVMLCDALKNSNLDQFEKIFSFLIQDQRGLDIIKSSFDTLDTGKQRIIKDYVLALAHNNPQVNNHNTPALSAPEHQEHMRILQQAKANLIIKKPPHS